MRRCIGPATCLLLLGLLQASCATRQEIRGQKVKGLDQKLSTFAYMEEGDIITFGSHRLQVLHTPGHTPGGMSLVLENSPLVFVGDTLFAGSIGRTDFPGGDFDALINGVRQKLFPLGDHYVVYPGHGPVTTIGHERQYNPFF